ncbi:NfeD family protein [Rhodococcoides corynebacterioides]|uniref:NfeD family protein n=1 Tax=Rhodococcoides corynebacterioides TaxID=53972 RepID=UPI00082EF513|nr:NfeD family protein [Rhodococcus corynebacterioides]MBY6351266.1 NfeD family protein [Rhodococcus corynebacterioides]MBY6364961.1 NfeD family protein [Rhodococcus corynebacterioides]
MVALLWVLGAVLLAAGEALSGDFFLLMLAGGALGTAGVSALTDFPVWGDALVFAALSAALILGVRPALTRRFSTPPPTPTGIQALTGRTAQVLEPVDEVSGTVRLDGDVWTARPLDPTEVYAAGTTVTVMKIDGATAVVWKGP